MPHGTPDWGLVGPKETTYGLDDLGEHAVRLGSPHLWDRRGDVLFCTDFREGLGAIQIELSGGLAAACLATGYSRLGAYALKLTAGNSMSWYAQMYKQLPYPVSSRIGIEATFSFQGYTQEVLIWGRQYDGVDVWYPTLIVDPNTGLLRCRTGVAAYHTILPAPWLFQFDQACNSMKLVWDMSTGQYVRAIVNENAYDLSGIGIYNTGAVQAPQLAAFYSHIADDEENPVSYLDCFIVTQNEP